MTLAGLLNQPLTIQRRSGGAEDDYGNPTVATTTTTTVNGYLEQTTATEVTVDRQTYITDWLVVLPPGTVLDGSDRIVYDGLTLEIVGQPHKVWNPRTRIIHHVTARAREVS